nr:reverse transcriptase domain-containing protein [Tanacetum cinerariifolium]
METATSQMKAKLQEGRISKPTKARAKARQIYPPHKNTKRNLGFRQREVQASSFNDNPSIKQWKRPGKGGKRETSGKEKPLVIPMVQSWQSVAKQKITQTFFSKSVISFSPLWEEDGTEGTMIVKAVIGGNFVHRISQVILATTPLVGFSGEIIWPLGQISLLVKIGDEEHSTSSWMNFIVVRSPSPYNGIIGRPGVRRIHAVPSKAHGMLKFPVEGKTVTLRSKHMLNIREGSLPVRQKKRGQAPERNKVIYEEVEKLVDADIMKEVHYHSWLL